MKIKLMTKIDFGKFCVKILTRLRPVVHFVETAVFGKTCFLCTSSSREQVKPTTVTKAISTPRAESIPNPLTTLDFEVKREANPIAVVTEVNRVEIPTSWSVRIIASCFSKPLFSLAK